MPSLTTVPPVSRWSESAGQIVNLTSEIWGKKHYIDKLPAISSEQVFIYYLAADLRRVSLLTRQQNVGPSICFGSSLLSLVLLLACEQSLQIMLRWLRTFGRCPHRLPSSILINYISKKGKQKLRFHSVIEVSFVYVTSFSSGCCTDMQPKWRGTRLQASQT